MNLALIIIDDSELDRFIIQRIAKHVDKSLSVYCFASASNALECIQSNELTGPNFFKILLLDLQMPVMNGFEFIEEFEKLPADVRKEYKIFILSTTRNPNDIARLLGYSAVDSILEKPITKERLYTIINRLNLSIQKDLV